MYFFKASGGAGKKGKSASQQTISSGHRVNKNNHKKLIKN